MLFSLLEKANRDVVKIDRHILYGSVDESAISVVMINIITTVFSPQ